MKARLIRIDDSINWAAVAGALCLWDVYAKYSGHSSASRWLRQHAALSVLFVLAVINHLAPRTERQVLVDAVEP